MFETIVIAAARDRVDEAVRGALAHHPVLGDDHFGDLPEPRVAPVRHRLGQALRRLSDRLDPLPSACPTPATDAR
jgi:hypothetical protein